MEKVRARAYNIAKRGRPRTDSRQIKHGIRIDEMKAACDAFLVSRGLMENTRGFGIRKVIK